MKVTFVTLIASALAGLTIGLAAPATAEPADNNGRDTTSTVERNNYPNGNRTPYGSYQNENKRGPNGR